MHPDFISAEDAAHASSPSNPSWAILNSLNFTKEAMLGLLQQLCMKNCKCLGGYRIVLCKLLVKGMKSSSLASTHDKTSNKINAPELPLEVDEEQFSTKIIFLLGYYSSSISFPVSPEYN